MGKHVLIIGGGVVGLCTAYYSLRQGHSVTILEKHPEHHQGCSYGNAGLIVPSHFIPLAAPGMVRKGIQWMLRPESPFYIKPRFSTELWNWGWSFYRNATAHHVKRSAPLLIKLNAASRHCFEELSSSLPDFELKKKGVLMLCKSEKALEEESETAELAHTLGMQAKTLTKQEIQLLEPHISMDVAGGVYFPDDAHLSPHLFMNNMSEKLLKTGAEIRRETEVNAWSVNGNLINGVHTSKGVFSADEYVLAGGSWSPEIIKQLGIRLPMQAGKGYSLTMQNPRELPGIPTILVEARIAVTPMGNALRFGGTMEIAGMDTRINPARIRGIVKSIPEYFPNYSQNDFRDIQPWCGLRPCSPDGLPYIGKFNQYKNLYAATGHAMMGVSLGPVTGKLITELLSDNPTSIPIEALSPNRYN